MLKTFRRLFDAESREEDNPCDVALNEAWKRRRKSRHQTQIKQKSITQSDTQACRVN